MEADLTALEEKVAQLVGVCQRLQAENIELRQNLAHAQDDVRQLQENMTLAGERLEALISTLPGEDSDE